MGFREGSSLSRRGGGGGGGGAGGGVGGGPPVGDALRLAETDVTMTPATTQYHSSPLFSYEVRTVAPFPEVENERTNVKAGMGMEMESPGMDGRWRCIDSSCLVLCPISASISDKNSDRRR